MDIWYSKELGDGMMSAIPSSEIKQIFLRSFTTAGEPLEMAVFTRHESEGRLHCEVIAYFSPAAKEVAKAIGALPCEKPARAGLGLLAGDRKALSALFPEDEGGIDDTQCARKRCQKKEPEVGLSFPKPSQPEAPHEL
ncbi:MAG: hypothetical protein WBL25_12440 [Anaerolineales bacterium]